MLGRHRGWTIHQHLQKTKIQRQYHRHKQHNGKRHPRTPIQMPQHTSKQMRENRRDIRRNIRVFVRYKVLCMTIYTQINVTNEKQASRA